MVSIVVAHSRNHVIGRAGDLPWRLPSDLKRFRELTEGGTVVMGRKTFESLPQQVRPLPNRRNLILSTTTGCDPRGTEVFPTFERALDACDGDCFVIGGGTTYAESLGVAQTVYATEIDEDIEGDTFFPALSPDEWACVAEEPEIVESDLRFSFKTYARPALYDVGAARGKSQRRHMEQLQATGVCIFCPEHVGTHHAHPVEWKGEHWYVTRNAYPYAGTVAHFLIVPLRHITSFDELPDAAGAELWSIKRMLKAQVGANSFASVERSDDLRLNGGSVAHLHVHFVAVGPRPAKTVRFRVSARAD